MFALTNVPEVTQDQNLNAPANSTVTSVAAVTTNVTLLAANSARKGGVFFYSASSSKNLFLKLGAIANTTTSYTIKIPGGGYFELPFIVYTGQIDGIFDSTTGSVLITELT